MATMYDRYLVMVRTWLPCP